MAIAITILLFCGLTTQFPEVAVCAQVDHTHNHTQHTYGNAFESCVNKVASRNLSVYSYLALQGANSTTSYNTAQCGGPVKKQPNGYAVTYCFDMPLLLEQDLSSELLGVVQGTYVYISLTAPGSTLFVSQTFTLNTSNTAQGTFSATGLDNIGQVSSKPITGGTDAFAFHEGVVITTPRSNATVDSYGNTVAWLQYDFTFRPTPCN